MESDRINICRTIHTFVVNGFKHAGICQALGILTMKICQFTLMILMNTLMNLAESFSKDGVIYCYL